MTAQTRTKLLVVGLAVLVSAVGAGAVLASSHASDDVGTQSSAHLRVVHASPDAPAVDVSIDNETALANVSFGAVSDYVELAAGNHTVTIAANGTGDVVFAGNVTLDARSVTTLAAAGEVAEDAETAFGPATFEDDAYTPTANESAIRLVHLSPDAPAVDVTALPAATMGNETEAMETNATVLAENLTFRNASDYTAVPAGDYTVQIRQATPDNDGQVVATVNVTLAGETAYSGLATGYVAPPEDTTNETTGTGADTALQVSLAEDATRTLHLPSMADDDAASTPAETATPTASNNDTTDADAGTTNGTTDADAGTTNGTTDADAGTTNGTTDADAGSTNETAGSDVGITPEETPEPATPAPPPEGT